MGGSFAAEHGLGRAKVAIADMLRDPLERDVMVSIKKSLDGANQLNPEVQVSLRDKKTEMQNKKLF
jgi:FAD/FMN-containing dehydrogenase